MTALEWLAWLVLLIVALAAGLAVTLSNAAVTRAIRRLERTYRRQKSLELEKLQAREMERRLTEVRAVLTQPDGWKQVLDQILADAVPDPGARVSQVGITTLDATPAPHFTVVGRNGKPYTFTTAPEAVMDGRVRGEVIPLDASLHPAARLEVQAVWDHLAAQRLRERPILPRQAEWFLVLPPERKQWRLPRVRK